ncbi:MAG: hypothetical protein Q7K28_00325 [Candidatus Wildermuthbacteria bacterium]|nr:hypothetical protein [Candidatus Wildermuthbacteria bacterium]
MPERTIVDHVAAVAIIINAGSPSQIFAEIKDDGLPIKAFRRTICPIGGNWIGQAARNDYGPRGTLCRELTEELSLEKTTASTLELRLLGDIPEGNFYQTPSLDVKPTEAATQGLEELKRAIAQGCMPFGDFIITIPRAVFDRADPQNKRDGMKYIVSYWAIALDETRWKNLVLLQEMFGNLSNESITVITSLEEIVSAKMRCAYGHDGPLRQFFLAMGLPLADNLPMIDGISGEFIGPSLASYAEYLKRYEVLRKPV